MLEYAFKFRSVCQGLLQADEDYNAGAISFKGYRIRYGQLLSEFDDANQALEKNLDDMAMDAERSAKRGETTNDNPA